ncbi:RNA-directed DNA polymerase [Rhodococcus qingshengii]|uniref:RNA-directed DNA polymerase n=1 Tax=Rhodococcus qingshengii TaxID=334542 RepID=UPI001F136F9F|nr:RNA-directed DNA polymerase [Rhodococcus qingshengii]ULD38925.1 RNA-directed DNA polymerase [Rhodococcus qingshengii]
MNRTDLLDDLDFEAAVTAELEYTTPLLPPQAATKVLQSRRAKAARLIRSNLDQGAKATPASVVLVSKAKGARPLNQWRLEDRVFYRALVERLRRQLPTALQSRRTHADFESAPYENDANEYICSADITAYYQYIDHDLLADELTAQTGDFHAVSALSELLEQVMGTRVGIPQVHTSSDVLGDTYIDPIRRALIRAGYDTYVYADDFRIGCPTLGRARAALEMCANEARSLGLVLNDSKTYTYTRANYFGTLNRLSAATNTLLEEMDLNAAADFLLQGEYDDNAEVVPLQPDLSGIVDTAHGADDEERADVPQIDDLNNALVRGVWTAWADNASVHQNQTFRQLLGQALPLLGTLDDTRPLPEVQRLLDSAPKLTPHIAQYLMNLDARDVFGSMAIDRRVHTLVRSDRLSEWQKLWLAYALGWPRVPHPFEAELDEPREAIVEWLTECVQGPSDALAAACAEALGRMRTGDSRDLAAAYGRVAPEYRLTILWALDKLDAPLADTIATSKFDRLVLAEQQ